MTTRSLNGGIFRKCPDAVGNPGELSMRMTTASTHPDAGAEKSLRRNGGDNAGGTVAKER